VRAVARASKQLERACRGAGRSTADDPEAALCMALLAGYPDRVAKRVRPGARQAAMAAGGAAEIAETSVVRTAEWLVMLDAEDKARTSGILVRIASGIEPDWLIDMFSGDITERKSVVWNAQAERVDARDVMAWGELVLHASDGARPPAEEAARLLA
jgi:ATP-dependent helicase HrpB